MLHEPVRDAGDVGAEPHPVGDGPCVDAAVDLASPIGQIFVLPAGVLREEFGRAALTQDGRMLRRKVLPSIAT